MEKTALQQFIQAISNSGIVIINQTLIDNCLQMEKQQIINCHVHTQKDCVKSVGEEFWTTVEFDEQDEQELKKEAEQYYQETFKSEKK
jgi:glutamate synthase domain-containing protein 2